MQRERWGWDMRPTTNLFATDLTQSYAYRCDADISLLVGRCDVAVCLELNAWRRHHPLQNRHLMATGTGSRQLELGLGSRTRLHSFGCVTSGRHLVANGNQKSHIGNRHLGPEPEIENRKSGSDVTECRVTIFLLPVSDRNSEYYYTVSQKKTGPLLFLL